MTKEPGIEMSLLCSAVINIRVGVNGVTVFSDPSNWLENKLLELDSWPIFLTPFSSVTIQTTYTDCEICRRSGSAKFLIFMPIERLLLLSFLILTTPSAAGTIVEVAKLILLEQALSKIKITRMLNKVLNVIPVLTIFFEFIPVKQFFEWIVLRNLK